MEVELEMESWVEEEPGLGFSVAVEPEWEFVEVLEALALKLAEWVEQHLSKVASALPEILYCEH